jgi:hypothetical protein
MINQNEVYAVVKKPTIIITVTLRLNRLLWFGHVHRMEEDRIHNKVLYMDLKITNLKGRLRNRWQDEVKGDGKQTA